MVKDTTISFPGKTFLAGEYAVLMGAPSVLVNTEPRFVFSVVKTSVKNSVKTSITKSINNLSLSKVVFHSNSPAGQWLSRYPLITRDYRIQCLNPYQKYGGFGYSTAQFAYLYYLRKCIYHKANLSKFLNKAQDNLFHIWQSYRSLNFEGCLPSGADLISQWVGKVCVFYPHPFKVLSVAWPFTDLDFLLVQTGVKLNTWEYLEKLQKNTAKKLIPLAQKTVDYFVGANQIDFIGAIREYGATLKSLNLVHSNTLSILDVISNNSLVLAVKGCGAMGAEVVCIFFHPKNKQALTLFLNRLMDKKLIPDVQLVTSAHLSCGFKKHVD